MLQRRISKIIIVKQHRHVRVFSSTSALLPYFPAKPSSPAPEPSAIHFPTISRDNPPPIRSIIYDYNVRLNHLGRCRNRLQEARKLFDEMPHKDVFSYTTMISIYLRNNDLPRAEELFLSLPEGSRGVAAETAMIGGYARAGRLEHARKLFDEMPHKNVYSWTCMMSGYFGDGQVEEGAKLFDQMPVKNVVSWTNLVRGYAQAGLVDKARADFDQMPERNAVSWTVMIEGYVNNDRIDEALELFNQCSQRNIYTWNVIISGLLANKRIDKAIQLFNSMPSRNLISWTLVITGLAENQLIELAREYFDRMPGKDIPAWNAMITAYAHERLMVEAEELFRLMPEKNGITWNAMIEGYARNGSNHEAFKHYNLMLRSNSLRPNDNTITSLVTSCQGLLELTASHSLVIKLGLGEYTVPTNALITAYSRAGDFRSAHAAFNELECKDIVSYRAMMFACSDHGHAKHILQAFAHMLRLGAKPDEIIFIGLLSCCARMGLVEKGKKIFYSMTSAFGLEPKREHYTCIVNILGRAGRLEAAMELLRKMPPEELDVTVVGALLSSCRLQGKLEMTSLISKQLMDHNHIEPAGSGSFMLLANTLAACGKWDEFAQARKEMRARKIKTIPGVSWIQVQG